MTANRVLKYTRTMLNTETGVVTVAEESFTQVQADEIYAVMGVDGLAIGSAKKLCEKWSARGGFSKIKYTYAVKEN